MVEKGVDMHTPTIDHDNFCHKMNIFTDPFSRQYPLTTFKIKVSTFPIRLACNSSVKTLFVSITGPWPSHYEDNTYSENF